MRFFGGKNRSGLVLLDFSVKKQNRKKVTKQQKTFLYTMKIVCDSQTAMFVK